MTRLPSAIAPLAGLAVTMVLLVNTRGLDEVARGDQLGPAFWPRLILLGLGLTCLAKLVFDWRGSRNATGDSVPLPEISRAKLLAGIALVILYVILAPAIGFAFATALFIVGFMRLSGDRSAAMTGANAIVGTVVLLYVFVKLVYLPLPKGDGPFETMTLALYRALRLF